MNKYNSHFLLDPESARQYAKDKLSIFKPDEALECIEIGDGNINYVFKVWSPQSQKSVVIKQADKFLRSSGRPLDLHRNKIEAEILSIENELAPEYVPAIYQYDEAMYALSMEDISDYHNLRKELMAGQVFPYFSKDIAAFLANTLLPTTDLVMDREEKKQRVKLFTNPELCDISEDLVFTEPYNDYKKRNVIVDGNYEFVQKYLYQDKSLHAEVGKLRNDFMNHSQALIHGDLHSGSIFINEKGLKVIDPEFAFYGPVGYDVGNVVGNLFLAWINKYYTSPENDGFLEWIENQIVQVVDLFQEKFSAKYDELVTFPLYKNDHFKTGYILKIIADAMGYAGTEIIRRVVGDAKVSEVTSVSDPAIRIPMERSLILIGIRLIKERAVIQNGSSTAKIGREILARDRE